MKNVIRACAALLLLTAVLPRSGACQRGPYRSRAQFAAPAGTPRFASAFIPGLGRVRITFTAELPLSARPLLTGPEGAAADAASIRLFRGRAQIGAGASAAAGASFELGGRPYLFVGFPGRSRDGRTRYYRLALSFNGTGVQVAFFSRSPRLSWPGSDQDMLHAAFPRALAQTAADPALPPLIELNLDADADWYAVYGAASNSFISAYANEAAAIYEAQLGISLRVVRQNVFKQRAFGSGSTESRIIDYQRYTAKKVYFRGADAHHLFSGSKIKHGVIGISYVASICISPYQSFAVTQHSSLAFIPITFAHELAHNLGARHDDSGVSIMNSVLSFPLPQEFSQRSAAEVHNFIRFYGACLQEQSALAVHVPLTLSAAVSPRGEFSARVSSDAARPDCRVDLRGSTDSGKIFDSGVMLASYYARARARTFSALLPRASTRGARGVPVFIAAEITCPDGSSGRSRLRRIASDAVRADGLTAPRWLKRLANLLR